MNDLLNLYIGLITFITQSETDSNFFYCVETNSDSRRGEHPIKIKREAGGRLGRRGRDKSWASCVDVAMATVTVSFWSGYFNWARPRECGSVCRCAPLVDCVHECVCVCLCWRTMRALTFPRTRVPCMKPLCNQTLISQEAALTFLFWSATFNTFNSCFQASRRPQMGTVIWFVASIWGEMTLICFGLVCCCCFLFVFFFSSLRVYLSSNSP